MLDRPLVLIRWRDASKNAGWTTDDDAVISPESGNITSVGWIHAESPDYLLLVSSLGEGQLCLQMQIPRATIIAIEPLLAVT